MLVEGRVSTVLSRRFYRTFGPSQLQIHGQTSRPLPSAMSRRSTRRTNPPVTAASEKTKALAATVKTAASARSNTSSTSTPTPTAADSIPILLFEDAAAWETWLETNHGETTGLLLKISKKGSSMPTVKYDEAVDVALCHGWIDGQRKSFDDEFFLQRFTPRRKNSLWSKRNVEKITVLYKAGRIKAAGQREIDAAKADGRWGKAYAGSSTMVAPPDFQAALDRNKKAKAFFGTLNKSQTYSYLWRIETTRLAATRKRKIGEFVDRLAEHKTF